MTPRAAMRALAHTCAGCLAFCSLALGISVAARGACVEALDVNERAVDGHIKNLRRKLAAVSPSHGWIRSVYGVGFSFAQRPG